ncbi:MAG: NifB/NifX family molybdenum-iron cluster-binding protein [Deltaproteobacteria bacterium]|nr:NifB/NifX family molybdenum-iron cluster-binding protein [Deltaproteobacteria bacterium]
MWIAIPVADDRISPVLDVARRFLVVELSGTDERSRREVVVEEAGLVARARRIAGLGCEVLVCGAVSRPLESLLASAGVRVVPNTCGSVDEVLAALRAGGVPEDRFLMPGCRGPGRGRRFRNRYRGGRGGW